MLWNFEVDSHGIEFSAVFRGEGDSPEKEIEITPPTKCKAEMGRQAGEFVAPCAGEVVLIFNNDYSRINKKTIRYKSSCHAAFRVLS